MNVIPSDCELSDTDDSDDEEYDEVEGDSAVTISSGVSSMILLSSLI